MKKTITKTIFIIMIIISMTITTACNSTIKINNNESNPKAYMTTKYMNFEESIKIATDIAIAEYVGSKYIGDWRTELEFNVKNKILGKDENKIYVYVQNAYYDVVDENSNIEKEYDSENLEFKKGAEYLLILERENSPYTKVNDICTLLSYIVIPVNDISKSTMWGEPIISESNDITFSKNLKKDNLISYISDISKDNKLAPDYLRSNEKYDIINNSKIILQIKIDKRNEMDELYSEKRAVFEDTEIYDCTVIKIIAGDVNVVENLKTIKFFSDTVKPGDKVIVAVEPIENGSTAYKFTSKNSLFTLNQYDEIMDIITAQEQEQEQVQD